ncbi:hypothetical protein [Bradyrhizobium sp. 27S5]|uniref:hypothetical protein n=1 Tax=Bradyrhizobium sp. 27S5 TaxID=3139728 RepID=UPI0030D1ACB9
MKVTIPVGVPLAPVTVAVKVTDCPALLGFAEDVSVAVEDVTLTFWVSADDVEPVKLVSPA